MVYLTVVLVLAYAGTVIGFIDFLRRERERTDAKEQQLINRIIAPQEMVAQTTEPSDEPQYITEEDEDRRFMEEAARAEG